MTVHELAAMQRDLLFVVYGMDDPYGQAIKRELESTQDRSVLAGHVYSNLNDLTEMGLIHKGSKNGRMNEYSLTEEGRTRVHDRIQWERQFVQR
jgi:DNA-binding PadR family transcriptional regulator